MSELFFPYSELRSKSVAISGEDEAKIGSYLGRLGSGQFVFDRAISHLAVHTSVLEHLPDTLRRIHAEDLSGNTPFQVDFDKEIGLTECVKVNPEDEIVWAQRASRPGYTRFVLGRNPESTNSVSVVLSPGPYINTLRLITAYIGRSAPPEIWDRAIANNPRRLLESRRFWLGNGEDDLGRALVFDENTLSPKSLIFT